MKLIKEKFSWNWFRLARGEMLPLSLLKSHFSRRMYWKGNLISFSFSSLELEWGDGCILHFDHERRMVFNQPFEKPFNYTHNSIFSALWQMTDCEISPWWKLQRNGLTPILQPSLMRGCLLAKIYECAMTASAGACCDRNWRSMELKLCTMFATFPVSFIQTS